MGMKYINFIATYSCTDYRGNLKKDAAEASFDEVKEQIKSQLKQQKQGDAYSKKVAELTEKYKEK